MENIGKYAVCPLLFGQVGLTLLQKKGDVPKSPFNNQQLLPSVGTRSHSTIGVRVVPYIG
jgi:hypothetical protein